MKCFSLGCKPQETGTGQQRSRRTTGRSCKARRSSFGTNSGSTCWYCSESTWHAASSGWKYQQTIQRKHPYMNFIAVRS